MDENRKEDEFDIVQKQMQRHIEKQDANLCIPSLPYVKIPGSMYVPELQSVFVDPDPEKKDVYQGSSKTKFRLHKRALDRIAQAGNIIPFPERSGPIRLPGVIAYKAVAGVRNAMGEIVPWDGYKDLDLEVEKSIIEESYEAKRLKWKGQSWWNKMPPALQDDYVNDKIHKEYIALRRYAPEKCESGAKARLMRALFPTLSLEFTFEDLKKPFVVLRWRLNLNHEDPEIRSFVQDQQRLAAMNVFGNTPGGSPQQSLPSPMTQALPEPIDPGDDPNLAGLTDQEEEPPAQPEPEQKGQAAAPPLTKAKADFEACDHKGKIEVLEKLMEKKAYPASDLNHPLSSKLWIDHPESLVKLFDHLSTLPDAVDEIPY
jgi:hypothetical protein